MTVKKEYNTGDTTWIHGVGSASKFTKGTVIKKFTIDYPGFDHEEVQYIISVPTHIESLLEIRNWQTMSQDEIGPIGMYREIKKDLTATNKLISRAGYQYDLVPKSNDSEDEPSDEEIYAALEYSIQNSIHKPLILKDQGPKVHRRPIRKKPRK